MQDMLMQSAAPKTPPRKSAAAGSRNRRSVQFAPVAGKCLSIVSKLPSSAATPMCLVKSITIAKMPENTSLRLSY